MIELSYEYTELLAKQSILISALLGGLSTTVLATLLLDKRRDKLFTTMIVLTILAAFAFIIATFAMNNLLFISHPDYPLDKGDEAVKRTRTIGGLSFYLGVLFFCGLLGVSGWLRSKWLGILTSILGILSYFLLFTLT